MKRKDETKRATHLHLRHDVEQLPRRHRPNRLGNLVRRRLPRLDGHALRQRPRARPARRRREGVPACRRGRHRSRRHGARHRAGHARAGGRRRTAVPAWTSGRLPVASSSTTASSAAAIHAAVPTSAAAAASRARWRPAAAEALARRRVVRVGKVEAEAAPADFDALEVAERRGGRVGVAVLAEAKALGLAGVVVKYEAACTPASQLELCEREESESKRTGTRRQGRPIGRPAGGARQLSSAAELAQDLCAPR